MKRFRRVIRIAIPSVLALLAAGSVVGAFLGPPRAQALLTGGPASVIWAVLVVGLLVAAVVDVRYRRIALAAAHGGAALIVIGSFLAGEQGHVFLARMGMGKVHRGVTHVSTEADPDGTKLLVAAHQSIERLPIQSHLVDYDPLVNGPWLLKIERVVNGQREEALLDPHSPDPQEVDGITVIIEEMLPATYERGRLTIPPVFGVRVTHGENETAGVLIGRWRDRGMGVSLQELYVSQADPTGEAGWLAAGGPWLVMDPPWGRYVSSVQVALVGPDGRERIGWVSLNRPMQYAGYQFFWTGYAGRESVMLTVVSDTGWPVIQAGIVLVLAGLVGCCWVELAWRAWRRRDAA